LQEDLKLNFRLSLWQLYDYTWEGRVWWWLRIYGYPGYGDGYVVVMMVMVVVTLVVNMEVDAVGTKMEMAVYTFVNL
jgi:hypothetical protein